MLLWQPHIMKFRNYLELVQTLQTRLRLLPYDGTPEIKKQGSGTYLYVRKRTAREN